MRVLLVEDDELLGEGIRAGLKFYHYTVDWVKNGIAALQALESEHFDMLILDLNLPQLSGEEVLQNIRAKNNSIPVIILTGKSETENKISNLDLGADDYLAKPFDLEELCARMRAIQRRTTSRAESVITVGDVSLNQATLTVKRGDQEVELSRREFVLLQLLLENAGKVLKREILSQSIYGWGDDIDSNAIEVHVHNLRKKLGTDNIKTIRGVGYVFKKPQSDN